jgi:hypothetical protein
MLRATGWTCRSRTGVGCSRRHRGTCHQPRSPPARRGPFRHRDRGIARVATGLVAAVTGGEVHTDAGDRCLKHGVELRVHESRRKCLGAATAGSLKERRDSRRDGADERQGVHGIPVRPRTRPTCLAARHNHPVQRARRHNIRQPRQQFLIGLRRRRSRVLTGGHQADGEVDRWRSGEA